MHTAFKAVAPAPGLARSSTAASSSSGTTYLRLHGVQHTTPSCFGRWQKPVSVPEAVCSGSVDGHGHLKSTAQAHLLNSASKLPAAPDTAGVAPQRRWNAVCLAYLGDGVWEAALRQRFYDPGNHRSYNDTVASMANTQAQAACYQLLLHQGWVTDDEAALMRWATNSSSVAPPAHATRQQYKQATAVETLVAHLYLTDPARLHKLLDWLLGQEQRHVWQQPIPARSSAAKGGYGAANGVTGSVNVRRHKQTRHPSRERS